MKLKFTADVKHMAKMDMPVETHGYYAYLYLNNNVVHSWLLSKLDLQLVRPEEWMLNPGRNRYVSYEEDGLAEFIAGKFGTLLQGLTNEGS